MADIRINALANTATSAASDDYLALDGSANGTRKILATNVAQNVTDVTLGSAGPSVKSTLSARAPRQGLVFDGTASATVSVPAFGTSDFTIDAVANTNDATAANYIVAGITGSFYALSLGNGSLYFYKGGGTARNVAGVFTSKKTVRIAISKSSGVISTYVNGVLIDTWTDANDATGGYTQPISGIGGTSTQFWAGYLSVNIYNRALSASEVVALYEAGAPAGADYNSASNTSIITGANSDFSSDTGYWTKGNGATISGGKANLTGGANSNIYRASLTVAGKRYRMTVTVDAADSVAYISDGNVTTLVSGTAAGFGTTGTKTFEFTVPSTASTGIQIISASGTLVLDNLLLYPLGLLLAPDAAQAGGGYVWNDQSGNLAQIVLPSSGVQWALPSVAGQRIRGTTSTNGNQQLLGASVLLPSECQITHVRARARTGTPTITIGTASGGAQIVASVALSTTWLNCTIALTGGIVSSADDIWVGSNSTDVVETDIAFQPLDF